jgi:hypothetical protein
MTAIVDTSGTDFSSRISSPVRVGSGDLIGHDHVEAACHQVTIGLFLFIMDLDPHAGIVEFLARIGGVR